MSDLEKITDKKLLTSFNGGRPCEACGLQLSNHEWVYLDEYGFVVACNELPTNEDES